MNLGLPEEPLRLSLAYQREKPGSPFEAASPLLVTRTTEHHMKTPKRKAATRKKSAAPLYPPGASPFDCAYVRGESLGREWAIRAVGDLSCLLGWLHTANASSPVKDAATFERTGRVAGVIFKRELREGEVQWNRGFVNGFIDGVLPLVLDVLDKNRAPAT